jgi:hypothetical protein
MKLPFTHEQFLDVFGAYNAALWPFAAALWLVSAAVTVQLLRRRVGSRTVVLLLAGHWAWSGIAYHALFFSRINPAARLFAGVFVLEALVLVWFGLARRRLMFDTGRTVRHVLGFAFIAYSFAYPGLALLTGLAFPRTPTYGVPCPTTLLTAGMLLLAVPPVSRWLFIVPILWACIGGSAALTMAITPDVMLFVAGLALLGYAFMPSLFTRTWIARTRPA